MKKIPVTFGLYDYLNFDPAMRSSLLQEFRDNGAEYLILSTPMLYKILETPAVADQLQQEIPNLVAADFVNGGFLQHGIAPFEFGFALFRGEPPTRR